MTETLNLNRFSVQESTNTAGHFDVVDSEGVEDTVSVSDAQAAVLVAAAYNDDHIMGIATDCGQTMEDIPIEAQDNSSFERYYNLGYEWAIQERADYAQTLMDKYPDADPQGADWDRQNGFGHSITIWEGMGRYDSEIVVNDVVPTIWAYIADNDGIINELPSGNEIKVNETVFGKITWNWAISREEQDKLTAGEIELLKDSSSQFHQVYHAARIAAFKSNQNG